MKDINRFIAGFKDFQKEYFGSDTSAFKALKKGQNPKTMVIACSDSRVDPVLLTNAGPGDIFTIRNVANLVPPCEFDGGQHGVSAALEFAVCHLGVEHIIILGHAQCGGINGLMSGIADDKKSFIGRWMSLALPAKEQIDKDLSHSDPDTRAKAAEHASILLSIENLQTFPFIADRVKNKKLFLHGWYFDLVKGELWAYSQENKGFEKLVE